MKLDALSNLLNTASGSGAVPARAPVRAEPAAPAQDAPASRVDTEQLQQAAEAINRHIQAAAPNLQFSVDEDTGKTVVRVVDTNTGETIRQLPSEELLAISRSIDRLQGLLLDGEG